MDVKKGNKNTLILYILLIIFALFAASFLYMNYVTSQKEILEFSMYKNETQEMKKSVESMIQEKKKATTAIAISIASNGYLSGLMQDREKLSVSMNQLVEDLHKNTYYKNIWIQIFDREKKLLYRSWTDKEKTLDTMQENLSYIEKSKKILTAVSIDNFDLSIKSLVPFYNNGEFRGTVEVISRLNSISKNLKKLDIESVVLVNKTYSKKLQHPFTKLFLDKYYVANLNASPKLLEYLQYNGIENYFDDEFKVENGYLITTYKLYDIDRTAMAYYIMFKKLSTLSTVGVDFFVFKWITIALIFFMGIMLLISIYLFIRYKNQKRYYKNIINTSTNIIIISQGKRILSANRAFYKYFTKYRNLEEFEKEHRCICDFFMQKSGYLQKTIQNIGWLDYIVLHSDSNHKVKIEIEDKIYYFLVVASLISEELKHYAVTFSDITEQEEYKKELVELTITDPLTKIGNRRYYHKRIQEEISRALRYSDPLSLILFDIDHFKKVNDEHGHDVGDEVLIEYSSFISFMLRDMDEFCRIGGEEFIIIAPHIDKNRAHLLAEKLRKAVEAHKKIVPITMSFGVTQYIEYENQDSLFKRADDALYKAKHNGRNKVIVE